MIEELDINVIILDENMLYSKYLKELTLLMKNRKDYQANCTCLAHFLPIICSFHVHKQFYSIIVILI